MSSSLTPSLTPSQQADEYIAIRREAKELLKKHGLTEWTFSFDRAKTRAGVCHYRSKTIALSVYYVKSPLTTREHITDTLLHELAHALTPGHTHDAIWKAKAIELGSSGDVYCRHRFVPPAYTITCPCNAHNLVRYRVHPTFHNSLCVHCRGDLRITKN